MFLIVRISCIYYLWFHSTQYQEWNWAGLLEGGAIIWYYHRQNSCSLLHPITIQNHMLAPPSSLSASLIRSTCPPSYLEVCLLPSSGILSFLYGMWISKKIPLYIVSLEVHDFMNKSIHTLTSKSGGKFIAKLSASVKPSFNSPVQCLLIRPT